MLCYVIILFPLLLIHTSFTYSNHIVPHDTYRTEFFAGNAVRSRIGCDNHLLIFRQGSNWKIYNANKHHIHKIPRHYVHSMIRRMPHGYRTALQSGNGYILVGQYNDADDESRGITYYITPVYRVRGGGQFWVNTFYSGTYAVTYGAIAGCALWTASKATEGFKYIAHTITGASEATQAGDTIEASREALSHTGHDLSELPAQPTIQANKVLQQTKNSVSSGDAIETAGNIGYENASNKIINTAVTATTTRSTPSGNSSSGNTQGNLPIIIPKNSKALNKGLVSGTADTVRSTLEKAPRETQEAMQGVVAQSATENPSLWASFTTHFCEWKQWCDACIEPVAQTVSQVGWYIPDPF